ncbi:MAG: hypothetical protein JWQ66_381 [Mucilaginibacter sp.]|nr:hypothetical protein [Mucilaginibacter sp.]
MSLKLEKNQTGIAGEFYVAGELSWLGYNVTITFGHTKSVDLLIQKQHETFAIQVKSIQATKSICWTIDKTKVFNDHYYVLVNLHVNYPERKPAFFVLKGHEVKTMFTDTLKAGEKRTYLDYRRLKLLPEFENRWHIFGQATETEINN